MSDCADKGSPSAQGQYYKVLPCVMGECALNFSPQCFLGALNKECADVWNECQTVSPPLE